MGRRIGPELDTRLEELERKVREGKVTYSRNTCGRTGRNGKCFDHGLSSREIATLCGCTHKTIQEIERKAIRHLFRHPVARQIFHELCR